MSELVGRSLTLDYGDFRAVDELTIGVRDGEIAGLLGPNGAGKTSSFYMIVGLLKPKSGRVELDGVDITSRSLDQRARAGIAYLPQEASAFRELSVEDNFRAVLEFQDLSREKRTEITENLISDMGLSSVRKSKARVLSGGERRRLEIGRSLAISPKFLLLDEPFAGIDPKQVGELKSLICSLKNRGIGILITDHNVHELLDVVDHATIIFEGRALKTGVARDIVDDPDVRRHYLGDTFRWNAALEATQ